MRKFHTKQYEAFKKAKEDDALAHAYLFTGPSGVGKYEFAREIAFWIQGVDSDQKHPDITETPVPLPIKVAKELKRQLKTSAYSGEYKIVIIDRAENMHVDAANSLLKMIEEPPGKTIFLFVSSHPELMLDTIRSRCHEVKFFFVSDSEIEKNFNTEKIKDMRPHWTGRPANVKRLLQDDDYYRKIGEYRADCSKFLTGELKDRFRIGEKYAKMNKDSDKSFSAVRQDQGDIIRVWIEYVKELNSSDIKEKDKEKIIRYLLELYKNVVSTNANFQFLFNSFAINTKIK